MSSYFPASAGDIIQPQHIDLLVNNQAWLGSDSSSTGAAGAYSWTFNSTSANGYNLTNLLTGQLITFMATSANSVSGATLSVVNASTTLGPYPLDAPGGGTLPANSITANQMVSVLFNSGQNRFEMVGSGAGSGSSGATGPAGPTGPTGLQGTAGTNGSAGAQGIQGVTGPTGPTGLQGTAGTNGSAGAQGIQGVTGPTGPTGLRGAAGTNGSAGAQGIQGVTGPTGPIGLQGAAGTNGAQGPQGVTGPTGSAGDSYSSLVCQVSLSSNQSIAQSSTTPVAISWDLDLIAQSSLHSTTTNKSRLVASVTGVWQILGQILITQTVAAQSMGNFQIGVAKNGTIKFYQVPPAVNPTNSSTATGAVASIGHTFSMSAGDYIEVYALSITAAGTVYGIANSDYGSQLTWRRIG